MVLWPAAVFFFAPRLAPANPDATNAPAEADDYRPAQLLEKRPIYYPARAQSNHLTGVVKLELTVNRKGGVVGPKVIAGSGSGLLDLSAAYGVLGWKFKPAQRGGKPVEENCEQVVEFRPPKNSPPPAGETNSPAELRTDYTTATPYPRSLAMARRGGAVEVMLLVLPSGEIADVAIAKSSGYLELDITALATAYEEWRVKGTGATNFYTRTVVFQLPH